MRIQLPTKWKAIVVVLTIVGLTFAINRAFNLNLGGVVLLHNAYLYFVLAAFLPIVFIIYPLLKSLRDRPPPFYDMLLAVAALLVCTYLGLNGERITTQGWDMNAPSMATLAAFLLWGIALEALRRTAGLIVTLIALAFSLYPIFANVIPIQMLQGVSYDFERTIRMHSMGGDSILGLPLQVAGSILIGFLVFGVLLQHSGGAKFFYNLAQSAFGKYRGGSAKVSIVSSGFMGMVSGSAVSNVLTTGPMTIPAMKESGFSSKYAAGVEASASTGGTVTPPIMGSAAFLMVSFVGVPYSEIALAAAIPAFLYFFGIFIQIDAYSAKNGLLGSPSARLPGLRSTILEGWAYLVALVGLVLLLVVTGDEIQAPYWVIVFMLVVEVTKYVASGGAKNLLSFAYNFLFDAGRTVAQIIGIIAGVGLIVGGLSMTGVSLSLARELISSVGGSVLLILIAGALTSFILGMGMTVSAVYVLLAIVMAPALVQLGIDPIAAHLFVIYWATVSYITPPVAMAAFAAAGIAGTPAMSTSIVAMRLGAVKYLVPFAFAFNPALVAQGSLIEIVYTSLFAIAGVFFLGCAFEGWAIGAGRRMTVIQRIILGLAGAATFIPEPVSSLIGLTVGVMLLVIMRLSRGGEAEHVPVTRVSGSVVNT